MAKTDWTSLRIRRATLARLNAVRDSLRRAAELGLYTPIMRQVVDITLDDVLNVLIDRDQAKRERAARSKRTKRQGKTQAAGTPPADEA